MWRSQSRLSGLLDNVLFRWDGHKRLFASGALTTEEVDCFRRRSDRAVDLEIARVLPGMGQPEVSAKAEPAALQQVAAQAEQQQAPPRKEQQIEEKLLPQQDAGRPTKIRRQRLT